MTGHRVLRAEQSQLRGDVMALFDHEWAPTAESTTRGRVDDLRRFTFVGLGADRKWGARIGHG